MEWNKQWNIPVLLHCYIRSFGKLLKQSNLRTGTNFSIAIQKGPCSMRYREPTGTGTSVQPDLWTQKFTNSITDQIPSCISIASLLSIKSCKLCVNLFVPPFRLLFHCIFLSNFSQEMMLPRGGKQHKNEKQHWERLGQYTREASSLTIQVINSKQQSSHKSSSSLHLPH